jgi:hypothetical protein
MTFGNRNKPGMEVHACNPNYAGSIDKGITIQAGPGQNWDPIWKLTDA